MGSERRLYPRLDVDLEGHMLLEGSEVPFPVKVSNLSVTGAAVVSDIGLDPGKRVTSLAFDLPPARPDTTRSQAVTLDLSATVSRRITVAPQADEEPTYILGLEFQAVGNPVERLIHRFVFQRMLDRRSENDEGNRQRVPYRQPITLSYDWFGEFETQLTENLSADGMFIRSSKPYPPGTIFDFQLLLRDDFTLVKGRGEVVWIREREGSPKLPAGMGTRFVHIDDAGRDVIHRVVAHHLEEEAKAGDPAATTPVEPMVVETAVVEVEGAVDAEPEPDPALATVADGADETDDETLVLRAPDVAPIEETEKSADPESNDRVQPEPAESELSELESTVLLDSPEPVEPSPAEEEPPTPPAPEPQPDVQSEPSPPVAGYASVKRRGGRWLWLFVLLLAIAGFAAWLLL